MRNDFNWKEASERRDEICTRLRSMADTLEKDTTRDAYTDAEEVERRALTKELDILETKMRAAQVQISVRQVEDIPDANKQMRDCIKAGQRFELKVDGSVMRRAVDTNWKGAASGYADPASSTNPGTVTLGDIVEPLYPNTILSAVGAPLLTGLKGNYVWPVVEAFTATINDEGAALGDTKIPLNKLIAKPERIGVACPVTREALNETDDLLRRVATEYMPVAMADLMNKIMFSGSVVTGATNLYGPFVTSKWKDSKKSERQLTYTGDAPSLADLIKLKAAVLKNGIRPEQLCYVMSESTKALLEGTPKWSGAPAAIVENDRINGVPVFTTSYVDEGSVFFGSFKYAPQGFFGEVSFIVDPYTLARKNALDFVLNADYAITVLREQAFSVLTKANS